VIASAASVASMTLYPQSLKLADRRALERIGIDQKDRFGCYRLSHRCCLPAEITRLRCSEQAFAETGQTDFGHHRMVDTVLT